MMIIIPEDVLRIAEALSAPIDELGLSVRSYNGLRRWGITTVADVYRAYQNKQLPRIRNLGEKSVIEIEKHLEEHLAKVAHVNTSETPNSSDTISRAKAIEALKNDMASLDNIIKGMSANDVRLDAYVSQRNQVNYDIYTINNLPPAQPEQLGTNLAEVGTDCISRQAAIDICRAPHMRNADCSDFEMAIMMLPPAQPAPSQVAADIARIVENGKDMRVIEAAQPTPDQNGDLWITVPDIDKVTCIYVQESKSKFCRIFYEER